MEGFHAAVKAVVEQLAVESSPNGTVNLLPGFVSPADIRYLRSVMEDFGIDATILPDYSDTLDGPALLDYPLIPEGGTPLAAIRQMGGAAATVELGATLPAKTGGTVLEHDHGVKLHRIGMPIGIRATDEFFELLAGICGQEVPQHHLAARGRLVDSMVDGHKYIFGKRAVVYGEEDLVVGLTGFLAEIGIRPVLCASGGKSGRMAEGVAAAIEGLDCEMPMVLEDVDFFDIEDAGQRTRGRPGYRPFQGLCLRQERKPAADQSRLSDP